MALISRCNLSNYKLLTCLRFVSYRFNSNVKLNLKPSYIFPNLQPRNVSNLKIQQRYQSTDNESQNKGKETANSEVNKEKKLSKRAQLKQAVRDYGATIIVFHVAISLASLGICYIAISSGVDAVSLLSRLNFPESVISSKVAVSGSTFVMSYAVHKVFAPVRIGITLTCAPFVVRYLRKIKLLKPPK